MISPDGLWRSPWPGIADGTWALSGRLRADVCVRGPRAIKTGGSARKHAGKNAGKKEKKEGKK